MRIGAFIGRIFVVLFACLVASLAAGFVVAIAVLIPEVGLAFGPYEQGAMGVMMAFGFVFLTASALLPVLLVIVFAEAVPIRSVLFYAVAGAGLGLMLHFSLNDWDTRAFTAGAFARRELEIMVAAGIAAGFVYWLIAGRNAGRWRAAPAGA